MNKPNWKILFSIMLTVVFTASTVGFTKATALKGSKSDPITISFLTANDRFKDVWKDIAAQMKKDENITVNFQTIPAEQYGTVMKTRIVTGEVPDIIDFNEPESDVDLGASQNFVDLSNEPWVKRLVNPKLIKDPWDGKIYGLPSASSSFYGAVYYNKKVFKDLGIKNTQPKNYKEFLDILNTIKTKGKGIIPFYACNKEPWTTQIFMTLGFSVALYPKDVDTYNKMLANKIKWTDVPEFKQILTQYNDLYKNGYVNKDHLSASYDMAKEALATGKAAMILNGEWAASDIKTKWPKTELGTFIIPFNNKLIMGTGAYVNGLAIPKAGKQVENVKKFLNLWSQPKYQNMYFAKYPGFPAFKDVKGGTVIPCVQDLVNKYIKTGKFTYQINDPMAAANGIWGDVWNYYIEMTAGKSTPDQVLQKIDKKYQDYMKQNKMPGF